MITVQQLPALCSPHTPHSFSNLPPALTPLVTERRWLVWRWEANKKGKPTKVPYRADNPNVRASSTDSQTWSDYHSAVATVSAGCADGIGFALHEGPIGAFDLDNCRNGETGEIAPWALWLLQQAGSYAEITPSGTGLRILGIATGSEVHRKFRVPGADHGVVEVYRKAKRYITVSGDVLSGAPEYLAPIDAIIEWTVADLSGAARASNSTDRRELLKENRSVAPELVENHIKANTPPQNHNYNHKLPSNLESLVLSGPAPGSDRSVAFHYAVRALKDQGFSIDEIEQLLAAHPDGIAEKYNGRLRAEIERSLSKVGLPSNQNGNIGLGTSQMATDLIRQQQRSAAKPIHMHWHRDVDPFAERAWLVREMIAKVGKGLLSGQWGSAKTFIALDLSGCVMSGEPFAGRPTLRRGGVLFIAPEGASEIPVRLRGLVNGKLAGAIQREAVTNPPLDLADLPFAWIEECPRLVSDDATEILIPIAEAAAAEMQQRHGLPLALVIIDTMAAGAGFGDENSAAETQKVMNALERLSAHTGAFVLGVDHFGKQTETGTRGSSAKEAAADLVLAALATRDEAGNISNTRLAVRKVRGARTGQEIPYRLDVMQIGKDRFGDELTTCVVRFEAERSAADPVTKPKDRWPTSLRVFRNALTATLASHDAGKRIRPFGLDGPEVLAATDKAVRAEFYASYAADGETERQRADAKRSGYNRALKAAQGKGLIVVREFEGFDHLWLTHRDGSDPPVLRTERTPLVSASGSSAFGRRQT